MNVAADLFEYLHSHDKAELPGLGTFYVQHHAAEISPLTGTIEPPCRKLTFKVEETNDYSFVKSMAEKEFISEETALVWIKQYTDSLKEKLEKGIKCRIGELGELGKDFAGNIVFEAGKLNLLDDAFAFITLKNVKTFDGDEVVTPIRTKEPEPEAVEVAKEPSAEPVKEDVVAETPVQRVEEPVQRELPQESVSHREAVVAAELKNPVAESEVKEAVAVDELPEQEAVLNPIEKDVRIEDIIPASEEEKAEAQAAIEEERRREEEEKLRKEEDEERKRAEKAEKKRKKKAKKRRKRILVTILCILLFLLLCCGGFVAGFYFNLLPDKPFLKPITERLSYYITPKKQQEQKVIPAVQTPMETVEETSTETVAEEIEPIAEPVPEVQKPQPAKKTTKAKTEKKKEKTETVQTKPASESMDNNSPVVVQNYSRLGFDVIGGSFSNKTNAERLARKAKSLGYDSYVLSKVKSGSPIFYVSYGSRRTLKEANDLMAKMIERLGGEYYVISR